jgi:hypothetical protein
VLAALDRCQIVSYRRMVFFGLRSPLFLYDYAAHFGHKLLKKLRQRSKARTPQQCEPGDGLLIPPALTVPPVLTSVFD